MILIKNSITKTATQEDSATVSKPFSKNASNSATMSPATADHTLPVDEKPPEMSSPPRLHTECNKETIL